MAKAQLELARGEGCSPVPEGGATLGGRAASSRPVGFIGADDVRRALQHRDGPQVSEDPRPARYVMRAVRRGLLRRAHASVGRGCGSLDLDLRDVHTVTASSPRLADASLARGRFVWVRGWGWDGATAIGPRQPAMLRSSSRRRDGHAAWINRAARAALGVSPLQSVISEEAFDARDGRSSPQARRRERLAALESRTRRARGIGRRRGGRHGRAVGTRASTRRLARSPALPLPRSGLWLPEGMAESDAEAARREFPEGRPHSRCEGSRSSWTARSAHARRRSRRRTRTIPGIRRALRIPRGRADSEWRDGRRRGFPVAIHAYRGPCGHASRSTSLARRGALRHGTAPDRARAGGAPLRPPALCRGATSASVQPGHWRDDRAWLDRRLGHRPRRGRSSSRRLFARAGRRWSSAAIGRCRTGIPPRSSAPQPIPAATDGGRFRRRMPPPGTLPARDDRPDLRRRDQVPRLPRLDEARAAGRRASLGGRHAGDGPHELRGARTG